MGEDLDPIKPFVAKGVLSKNLFIVINKVFFCLQDLIMTFWKQSLEHSNVPSIGSPRLFVKYLFAFCLARNRLIPDIYERFITVCASATVIGMDASCANGKKFYKLTPQILTVLFEKVLKKDFTKRGGWKRLEKYLMREDYLEYFEALCSYRRQTSEDIPAEMKGKLVEFATRRTQFFLRVCVWENNSLVNDLTSEVFSSVDHSLLIELSQLSEDQKASSSVESVTSRLSELALGESGTSFRDDCFRVEDLDYDGFLQSHLMNFKRLMRSPQDPESPDSDEPLDNALDNMRKSLKIIREKMECALSIIQSLPQ
ncbi:hypothetical protein TNIN_297601 [Trichonephila inaurata madagascariensis]|uniref:Uncharacterized protein n=1 Tax=Trichonephila inaurata madagascariensis TaxID=2747483 RepID=A0A8X6XKE9_9ARAC|nr:hypothetical protein TNIN_297601 [Trichonephila inaurata madagascariensis]